MYRFYEEFVVRVLLILKHIKDSGFNTDKNTLDSINRSLFGQWESEDIKILLENVGMTHIFHGGGFDIDEMIDQLGKQIVSKYKTGDKDSDLIDTMVRILSMPRTPNILAGKTITKLRKAILTSDEMKGLKERVEAKELSCGTCGITFIPGEMTSIYRGSDGTIKVCCINCVNPSYVSCSRGQKGEACQEKVSVPNSLAKAIRKLCIEGCHSCKKPKVKDGVEGADIHIEGGEVGASPPNLDVTYFDEPSTDVDDELLLESILTQPETTAPIPTLDETMRSMGARIRVTRDEIAGAQQAQQGREQWSNWANEILTTNGPLTPAPTNPQPFRAQQIMETRPPMNDGTRLVRPQFVGENAAAANVLGYRPLQNGRHVTRVDSARNEVVLDNGVRISFTAMRNRGMNLDGSRLNPQRNAEPRAEVNRGIIIEDISGGVDLNEPR